MSDMDAAWERVRQAVRGAAGVSWDGCHKVYVLLDEEQVRQSRLWGYGEDGSTLNVASPEYGEREMMRDLKYWWEISCSLRFVTAVRTVTGNPNDGYLDLISQFEDDDLWEDYE